MHTEKKYKGPGYLNSLLRHRCPRCRMGDMFISKSSYQLKQFMKMPERCPVCSQPMEIEVGFYYGTSYVSYALTVAISAVTCVAWWVLIGFSLDDHRFFFWMGANMIFLLISQPYLMRLSRSIWLSFFVRYNEHWRTERPEDPERIGTAATRFEKS